MAKIFTPEEADVASFNPQDAARCPRCGHHLTGTEKHWYCHPRDFVLTIEHLADNVYQCQMCSAWYSVKLKSQNGRWFRNKSKRYAVIVVKLIKLKKGKKSDGQEPASTLRR